MTKLKSKIEAHATASGGRTDEELKEIALDLYKGAIFTEFQIQNKEDIGTVFMGLLFLEKKDRKALIKKDVGMIYEYLREALPRRINGYPMFMSFRYLNKADTTKVIEMYKKITETLEKI